MRRALAIAVLWCLAACAAPPPIAPVPDPAALERELRACAGEVRGATVGIYAERLATGERIAISADELFPTASLIKVPILCALAERIALGEISWEQDLTYDEDRRYPGEDILGAFRDGATIDLRRLVMLMLTVSDNTASLWLQELAGTGTAINDWLARHGFEHTRINSRTPGREQARELFGWGQTTPREMANLLTMIRLGQVVSPGVSERLYRTLCRSFWDQEALSAIPIGVEVASKQGSVSHSRSEVVLVHAPRGEYVFCVITRNQTDRRWDRDNEGYVLLRRVSAALWTAWGG